MTAASLKPIDTAPVFPIAAQRRELERELDMRRRVYPAWCQKKRMRSEDARERIEALKAAIRTLEAAQELHSFLHKTVGGPEALLRLVSSEPVAIEGARDRLQALHDALAGKR